MTNSCVIVFNGTLITSIMKRGALIVLEGCDRVGKTTQCKLLVKNLETRDRNAKFMNFPNRTTPCGQLIDAYLRNAKHFSDQEIHLLFTLNRWEAKSEMEKLLMAGTTLIVDRYSYSGVAFSAAKGLDLDWCKGPEAGLLKPDLVLFLTLTEEAAKARRGYGEERYETPPFQKKVKSIYEALQELEPPLWRIVDADKTEEDLSKDLLEIVENKIDNLKSENPGLMW